MSQKQDKKIRQLFRSQIREKLDELTEEYFGGDAPVFNRKPKYCPQWLWDKMKNIIIDNGFLIQYEARQKRKADENHQGDGEQAAE